MDQYCVSYAGKTLRPGVSRENAIFYLLALAKDKPVIVNRVAALMKVTTAASNIKFCGQSFFGVFFGLVL